MAFPSSAEPNQPGGFNARIVDDVTQRLDRSGRTALLFRSGRASVVALAGAAGEYGDAEGQGPEDAFHDGSSY